MNMQFKYYGTLLGLFFTIFCLVTAQTIVIPIISNMPIGFILELFFSDRMEEENYRKIGISVLITLVFIFFLVNAFFFIFFRKQLSKNFRIHPLQILIVMWLNFFIVHPLVFYINVSRDWSYANDGQFIFGAAETFPISSIFFFIVGLLIDIMQYNIVHIKSIKI
jgi:hypothetical protein